MHWYQESKWENVSHAFTFEIYSMIYNANAVYNASFDRSGLCAHNKQVSQMQALLAACRELAGLQQIARCANFNIKRNIF